MYWNNFNICVSELPQASLLSKDEEDIEDLTSLGLWKSLMSLSLSDVLKRLGLQFCIDVEKNI